MKTVILLCCIIKKKNYTVLGKVLEKCLKFFEMTFCHNVDTVRYRTLHNPVPALCCASLSSIIPTLPVARSHAVCTSSPVGYVCLAYVWQVKAEMES